VSEPAPAPTPPPADAAPAPAPPGEGLLSRLLGLRVASILAGRYVDLKLGDPGGLLILLLQAPLIGWLVGIAFDGKPQNKNIDFVLVLVAVWFGCFNGCREVVKERLIFLRERRAGVPVTAYLASKLLVLALLAAVQCLALVVLVAREVRFDSGLPLTYLTLVAVALAGTALGLLLSSAVKSQNSLIALVPIALIPQLIFSEAVIGSSNEAVDRIEKGMIAHWGLDVIEELRRSAPRWGDVLQGELALLGFTGAFLLLALLFLAWQEE
jgi:hypothetical protein